MAFRWRADVDETLNAGFVIFHGIWTYSFVVFQRGEVRSGPPIPSLDQRMVEDKLAGVQQKVQSSMYRVEIQISLRI